MNEYAVLTIAQLRALSKATYTRAYVEGYYAAGDGGGGAYWLDAADTTSADNGGTVIVATDGGRWKLSTQDVVNLKQFGARFDGTTDDTARIQAALNSGLTKLEMPAGTAVVSANLNLPGSMDFALSGQGPAVTMLKFTSGGIRSVMSGFSLARTLHLQGFTLAANQAGGTAIDLSRSGAAIESAITLRDIDLAGADGVHASAKYWGSGVTISGLRFIRLDNLKFWGRANNANLKSSQAGISIAAAVGDPQVNVIASGVSITSFNRGVSLQGAIEGIYWTGSEIWGCEKCFVCDRTGATFAGTIRISDSHLNSVAAGIEVFNTSTFGISNSEVYQGVATVAAPIAANLISLNGCRYAEISSSHISSAFNVASNGVNVANSQMVNITGNVIRSVGANGVAVSGASSSNILICGNNFAGEGWNINTGVYIAAGSNVRITSNTFGGVVTPVVDATGNAVFDRPSRSGTHIQSLAGGSPSEQFNIPVPAGIFTAKPTAAFISRTANASDAGVICNYDFDSALSTATNIRVTVRALSGTLPAGGMRFSYSASA